MESESTKEMATSLRSIYFVLGRLRVCREQKGRGRKNTEGSGCMRVEVYLSSKQRGKQEKAGRRRARQVKQWTRDTGNRTKPVNKAESGKGDDGCGGTDGIDLEYSKSLLLAERSIRLSAVAACSFRLSHLLNSNEMVLFLDLRGRPPSAFGLLERGLLSSFCSSSKCVHWHAASASAHCWSHLH